jgi:hypothetical protein
MNDANKKHYVVYLTGMLMLFLVLAARPVMAQFDEFSFVSIRPYGEGIPATSDSASPAEMGFQRAGISVSVLTLNVDYAYTHYTWNSVDELSFGNGNAAPWENLHMLSASGMYGGEITKKWSYLVMADGSTAFEDGVDDPLLVGALIGGGLYKLTDAWNLIAGPGVLYSNAPDVGLEKFNTILDDLPNVLPLPVVGVQWNQDAPSGWAMSFIFPMEAKVQFTTADQRFAALIEAFEQVADLKVKFSPRLATTLKYTLDDGVVSRLAHDTDEAYLKPNRNLAELIVNVTLPGNFSIDLGPYYALDQTVSVVDKHAEDIHKIELEDSFGVQFKIAWSLNL